MATRLTTLSYDDVEVGQELPELVIELTPTLIVATAIGWLVYRAYRIATLTP